jgi:hypothetical protein
MIEFLDASIFLCRPIAQSDCRIEQLVTLHIQHQRAVVCGGEELHSLGAVDLLELKASRNIEDRMILVVVAFGRELQPPAGSVFLQERIADCIKLAVILVDLIGRIQERKARGIVHVSHDERLISAGIVHVDVEK